MNEPMWRNPSTPPTEGLRQRILGRMGEAETPYLAAEKVRRLLDHSPELTGVEVLEELEARCKLVEHLRETAQCRHCSQLIFRFDDKALWRHGDDLQSRGCRWASFREGDDDEGDFDETLDRKWKAAPQK